MKVENEAILTCPNCRVEGSHKLLYLSNRLRASRCENCTFTQMFSGHIYAEYARDVTDRATALPRRLAGQAIRHPLGVFGWPAKALLKPLGLLNEIGKVTNFERKSHRRRPARR